MDTNETLKLKDLILALRTEFPFLPPDIVKQLVHELLSNIQNELIAGNNIKLGGMGTLRVKHHPAHTKKHPKTGLDVEVPASKSVRLRITKKFKEALRDQ